MKDNGLVRLENELELQQQQLEKLQLALDAAKRDHEQLSYTVSHDMQEPLRMVVNFVALLQKRYEHLFDQQGQEYIYYVVDGAKRMQGMIEQLLIYSRINSRGKEFELLDSTVCMQKAIKFWEKDIKDFHANMEFEKLPEIKADANQLEALFRHLIGNAIFYRSDDRLLKIKISARAKGAFWCFRVSDNGLGVLAKNLTDMFGLFKRFHFDINTSGSGMGLACCRQIVRRHGGEIWAELNEDEGISIVFTFLG